MIFTRSNIRSCKLAITTTLAMGMLTTASHAYTQEQQQMCTGDAMQLCGSEIPDVDRVTACMVRQQALLSPGCKAVFRVEPAAAATASPASYTPATRPAKPVNLTPKLKRG